MENFFVYLLVLPPDHFTDIMARRVKSVFKKCFGCSLSDNLQPHITLCNFLLMKHMEEPIVSYFDNFVKSVRPFEVQINGFGHFGIKTIFLNVISKKPIVQVIKDIRCRYRRFMEVDNDFPAIFPTSYPHMTIARKMLPAQFEKAWPEYEREEFSSSFLANEMVLLKKKYLSQEKYEVLKRFSFTGTDKGNIQLSLEI